MTEEITFVPDIQVSFRVSIKNVTPYRGGYVVTIDPVVIVGNSERLYPARRLNVNDSFQFNVTPEPDHRYVREGTASRRRFLKTIIKLSAMVGTASAHDGSGTVDGVVGSSAPKM